MSLEMCHLLFIHVGVDLKKLLENALRFETPVVLNRNGNSVTRNSFKYRLTSFQINFFKNDFSVHYFVFVYS